MAEQTTQNGDNGAENDGEGSVMDPNTNIQQCMPDCSYAIERYQDLISASYSQLRIYIAIGAACMV